MLITVAIPCYKSSKTIRPVVEGIFSEFASHPGYDCQIVLVNDGSPDQGQTWQVISALAREDSRITAVDLAKNFGQASAKMAALPHVRGDILIYMDDDGQHDPAGIFRLVEAVEAGADVAIAAFQGKQHSGFKRFTSWLNSEMLRITIQKPKELHTSSFAAYNRFIIEKLQTYESPFVSMFAFILQHTRRIVNVPMEHRARMEGQSGYTLKKLFKLWADGMFCFSTVPLKLIMLGAICCALAGGLLLIASLVLAILSMGAATCLILGVVFLLAALILMSQSLLGEYIGRMYMTQNQMPQYSVREVVTTCVNTEGVQREPVLQ